MNEPRVAPEHPLPQTAFYSVEYPGYVSSVDRVAATLPQRGLDNAFRRGASTLELHMRPGDPFTHPLHGDVLRTSNLVLRVVKRKRKDGTRGEYTATVVGSVGRTARFRAIADYQYLPDPDNHIVQLRRALGDMDVQAIKAFRFMSDKQRAQMNQPPRSDDLDIDPQLLAQSAQSSNAAGNGASPLGLMGPPLWSRNPVPLLYLYKPNPVSVVQTITGDNGEEKQRLVNRARWKGYAPATISFMDETVPEKPPDVVEQARNTINKDLYRRIMEKFDERPMWSRLAFLNQFSAAEEREMNNSKVHLPLCAYMFENGPWRDIFVRFGYDPRKDKAAYKYQRLYFRNNAHQGTKKSVFVAKKVTRDDGSSGPSTRNTLSHVFDGQVLQNETAVFQLCDIHDPLLKGLIDDPEALRDTVDEHDGWYKESAINRIRAILRRKFFGMLEGRIITDQDCADLLEETLPQYAKTETRRIRPGKNNMAKGAQRPELEIAQRLRKAICDQEADSDEYEE